MILRFSWQPIALDTWWQAHTWSKLWPSLTIAWTVTPRSSFYFHATFSGKSSAFRLSGSPSVWIFRQGFDLKVYRFSWKELAGILPLLSKTRTITNPKAPLPPLLLRTATFPLHTHTVYLKFTQNSQGYHGSGQWHTYPFTLHYTPHHQWSLACDAIEACIHGEAHTLKGHWKQKEFSIDYTNLQNIMLQSFWGKGTISYTQNTLSSSVTGTFTPQDSAITPLTFEPYLRIPTVKFSHPLQLVLKKTISKPWVGQVHTTLDQGHLTLNLQNIQAKPLEITHIKGPLSYDLFQNTLDVSGLTGTSHTLGIKQIRGYWSPNKTHIAFTVGGALKGALSVLRLWDVVPPKALKFHGTQTTTGVFQIKNGTPDIQLTGYSKHSWMEHNAFTGHCAYARWRVTSDAVHVITHWKKDTLRLQGRWHQKFSHPYGTLNIQGQTHASSPLRSQIRLTFGKNITGFFQWNTLHIKTFRLNLSPCNLETLQGKWQEYRLATSSAPSEHSASRLRIVFHHPQHKSGLLQWHNFPSMKAAHIILTLPYYHLAKGKTSVTLPTAVHLPQGKITARITQIFQDSTPIIRDFSLDYAKESELHIQCSGYSHKTPQKKSIFTHSPTGRWEVNVHGLQLGSKQTDSSHFYLLAHRDSRRYYHGSWVLKNYPMKTGLFFNRFLNMVTPLGWIQTLSTATEIKSRFVLSHTGKGYLSQGQLKTADLNASFRGDLSLAHLNLQGYATPVNVINTVLTWTPLRWWTGKRGLFSASFAIKGTPQNPTFTLNPFSGFAPQFLKSQE